MLSVLYYKTVPNYKEKRKVVRTIHLEHVKKYADRGEIIMGGALEDPADEALIIFNTDDITVAEDFARADPYVLNGLITEWRARLWNEVVVEKIINAD